MNKLEIEIKDGKIKAPLKGENIWLVAKPEEVVRQRFICRLVNDYGYSLSQMEQEVVLTSSKRGTGRARGDIVVWRSEADRKSKPQPSAFLVVECKAEKVKLKVEDFFQGSNYASFADAMFFVATNEKETKFFKVIKGVIPKDLEEIVDIPHGRDINNERKINELLARTKTFTRDEFQRLLFACHDVIRNNDKLSPEMAFDEISKILFMKIRYERQQDRSVFSREKFEELKEADKFIRGSEANKIPFYQYLFDQTKSTFAQDHLFEQSDVLRIREPSFLHIVRLLEKYNLSDTSDDVKGIAFEEFLGKTFRGDLGQFFTPRTIVDFMVSILDPQEGETICDPCCGTGGFLIKAFEHIREKIEHDIQQTKDCFRKRFITEDFSKLPEKKQEALMDKISDLFVELNKELEPHNKDSRLKILSSRCIYGTDAEPRSARTAKMNMIMHGDGHGGVHHHDGLLNVNGIFEERFDVIFTNPPFGARISREVKINENDIPKDTRAIREYTERYGDAYRVALRQVEEKVDQPLLSLYETGEFSTLTEVVFVERCLRLLKKGGRMGVVLPEGFLNNADLQRVREFFEGKAKILFIVSIPQDVFIAAGATVKPSVVFLKRFTDEEESLYLEIKEAVTEKINAEHQPEIEEANADYDVFVKKVTALNTELKSIKAKLKLKDTDQSALTKQLNEWQKLLTEAKGREKEAKKAHRLRVAEIEAQKQQEIKAEVKERFDYEIPIVQIEKAGITSTGAKCENEMPDVSVEFAAYRKDHPRWTAHTFYYEYNTDEHDQLTRTQREITVS